MHPDRLPPVLVDPPELRSSVERPMAGLTGPWTPVDAPTAGAVYWLPLRQFGEAMTEAATVDLAPLDRAECLRLLRQEVVGRVIFTVAAMPTALPVTYAVNDGEIVFRARVGGTLAHAVHNAVVAFETDALDPVTLTGWSVVGVGQISEVTDPARLDDLETGRELAVLSSAIRPLPRCRTGRRRREADHGFRNTLVPVTSIREKSAFLHILLP